MFERAELVLRIVCMGLATLLLYQLAHLALRGDPLARLNIPAVPSLAASTNAPPGRKGTNAVPVPALAKTPMNSVSRQDSPKNGTNAVAAQEARKTPTNFIAELRLGEAQIYSVPSPELGTRETNSALAREAGRKQTNSVARQEPGKTHTNSVRSLETGKTATATATRLEPKSGPTPERNRPTSVPSPAPARMGPGSGPGTAPEVPPAIRARVDRITQSEIFGPVPKPKIIPMALLGIAGNDAFLRAPTGETGLLKEGEELGGVKLLRIGTNRVLVEHEGQQKELIMFSGFGGETLLPKGKEKPQ